MLVEPNVARLISSLHDAGMERFVPGFAIIRVDPDVDDDEQRVQVKRVVWSQDFAESEVQRLNALNEDKGCRYFWQYTRVDT